MKQYNIYLSMAALAIVGVMMSSCAEEIEVAQPANTGKTVMVKTTVSLGENATTRALTSNGVKTFAVGEQIAVIYKNTDDQTVKTVSLALTADDIDNTNAHNATFSVPLTNPNPGGAVRYIYPASMVADNVSATTPDNDATIKWTNLATQDGTLAKLSSYFDLATFDGNLTESGTLPATTAMLVNPLTIGKFTIKNSGGTDITSSITGLNISDGTNTYAVSRTADAGPIYVAMQAVSSQTVTFNAFTSDAHFTKSVTDKTLAASNIYDITVNTTSGANLSLVTANYIAKNGEVLTGTLGSNVKVSIADGATVTLNGVTINGVDDPWCDWAGITCEGDATIILADGSTNTVRGFDRNYPGIIVAGGKTLTIKGNGSLNASSYGGSKGGGAGIGGGDIVNCGNIIISGGNINAVGGQYGAGIGGGYEGTCGNITISGGNINAVGGQYGAGIGGGCGKNWDGNYGKCGNITITTGVTKVVATKGSYAQHSIGKGESGDCGTVTIGCTLDGGGNPVGGSTGYISTSPYTYQP